MGWSAEVEIRRESRYDVHYSALHRYLAPTIRPLSLLGKKYDDGTLCSSFRRFGYDPRLSSSHVSKVTQFCHSLSLSRTSPGLTSEILCNLTQDIQIRQSLLWVVLLTHNKNYF